METSRRRIVKIDLEMSDPNLFSRDADKAVALGQERSKLEKSNDAAEMRWLEISEALERAS